MGSRRPLQQWMGKKESRNKVEIRRIHGMLREVGAGLNVTFSKT